MLSLLCVVAAYLIGSISFAIVASRIFRLPDPRSYGSGNPGATNVLRSGRKAAALVTLLGDATKGLVTILVARHLAPVLGFAEATVAACGVAVFLGHLYPVYFGFKGGKGVATALGVLLGLDVWIALVGLVVFALVAIISRYVSLASVVTATVLIVVALVQLGLTPIAAAIAIIAVLVIWRHRGNMVRLMSGSERKLSFRRSQAPPADRAA
jgi:acyl phosphate:glycerol-3-phosphate acyltransferase